MKNPALVALSAVAAIGLIVGLVLYAVISAGFLNTYDAEGPSPLLALIPAGVGVLAGIAALLLWGMQQGRVRR